MLRRCFAALFGLLLAAPTPGAEAPLRVSGRYPHLAVYNRQGECGIGAVASWAERLWMITYGPHLPEGSDDKLYEIDSALNRTVRPESVGGTPANRMIHRESNQLNIGPYFIDAERRVRVIPPKNMYGRLTATARHLTDPANKLYICDMEGLIYEVDVHTLAAKLLFKRPVPGWHGKGGYSGQGRLVLAYNGEHAAGSVNRFKPFDYFIDPRRAGPDDVGSLSQWDGRQWRLIHRRQFLDVTGPGGIYGPADQNAPLWSIGWDRRSALLALCDGGQWRTFRLPIADYSYTGDHGWHTEWPRIREVGGGHFLMNLHGGWFNMPGSFSAANTGGLRALADYLKITGDFCAWNGRLVFGCDAAAKAGFFRSGVGDTLNGLNGQSNSNLWFSDWNALPQAGRPAGFGGPWVRDDVRGQTPSDPFLLAGYDQRVLHLSHRSAQPVRFAIELDERGDNRWKAYKSLDVPPAGYAYVVFPRDLTAQWARITLDRDAQGVTAFFHCGPGGGAVADRTLFAALADVDQQGPWCGGVVRSEGDERILLGALLNKVDASGAKGPPLTYQVDAQLKFCATEEKNPSARFLQEKALVTKRLIDSDASSVIVTEGNLRVRLPKGRAAYEQPWATGWPRPLREIVTERALLNAAGSFYVLPRDNSGGLRAIKPVCTHNKRITDFCSWRGLLVMAGCTASAQPDGHYFPASEKGAGLWFGDIDDLWKLGKPVGRGGPWHNTPVAAGVASDPYLMAGYDRKTAAFSHDAPETVVFKLQVDVAAHGDWLPYAELRVPPGKTLTHAFPDGYAAHWIRVEVDRDCRATAEFEYR